MCVNVSCEYEIISLRAVVWPWSTVARYGHVVDLFFTPRAHVNHIYVHTSSSTCERGVLRANVDMVDVRTWSEK